MEKVTFDSLPDAICRLWQKLEQIEQLLLNSQSNTPADTDQLLNIEEAGKLISLSVPTIYGLVSKSEIPVSKKGKRLYFSKFELMEWVKSGRKKTAAELAAEADAFLTSKRK